MAPVKVKLVILLLTAVSSDALSPLAPVRAAKRVFLRRGGAAPNRAERLETRPGLLARLIGRFALQFPARRTLGRISERVHVQRWRGRAAPGLVLVEPKAGAPLVLALDVRLQVGQAELLLARGARENGSSITSSRRACSMKANSA